MKRAEILTPWVDAPLPSGLVERRPLAETVASLVSWADTTAQAAAAGPGLPDPNLFAIEAVMEDASLALIEADARLMVLWSEDA